jgi:hypothetical protein
MTKKKPPKKKICQSLPYSFDEKGNYITRYGLIPPDDKPAKPVEDDIKDEWNQN